MIVRILSTSVCKGIKTFISLIVVTMGGRVRTADNIVESLEEDIWLLEDVGVLPIGLFC